MCISVLHCKAQKFINGYADIFFEIIMSNPHKQLIETICDDVLPNMVRIYESKKMDSALDQDQFVKLIEQKIERANKSLKMLSAEEQHIYREKIDAAYAENIDRLRKKNPDPAKSLFVKMMGGLPAYTFKIKR